MIKFYDINETWVPNPNTSNQTPSYKNKSVGKKVMTCKFENNIDTLVLDGSFIKFHRVKNI